MKELFAAMVAVQAACESPKKNALNPHFKKKYADLSEVLDVLREPLETNGLAIIQMPTNEGAGVGVHTLVAHTSGQTLDCGKCIMPLERPGPQAAGIAITYARRYSVMSIFRLSAEDDDAETAEGRGKSKATKAAEPKRSLDDVAEKSPLDDVHACGIQYDGKEAPALPKGQLPIIPEGKKHAGQSMDTVPVGYLRSIYRDIPDNHAHKPWARYFIEAHAFAKLKGGE